MSLPMKPTAIALGAAAFGLLLRLLSIGRRPKNYPPGPPMFPVPGNIHQVRLLNTKTPSLRAWKGPLTDVPPNRCPPMRANT